MTRCQFESCKKKLPLTAFSCRCNKMFCAVHRPSETHKCSFNYFEENQKNMTKNISSITFSKKEIILREII
jgi:AN1-like Zinc finger